LAQDIVLQGLKAPLRLLGAGAVEQLLPGIATGWPFHLRPADPAARPFFTITAQPGAALFRCENHVEPAPARQLDALNAACDAMAGLAQAFAAEDAHLLCLHAAGVEMAGRLVVFPNVRRAGKSTLAAAMAHAGHRVFSDDVLPLTFPPDGLPNGLAMGIAPRLRLPVTETASADFRAWVSATPGPQNRQYKYLMLADQPAAGERLPLGAFVILDRQTQDGPAQLAPVNPDVAMDALLHQNFTRDRHSGDILTTIAATLSRLPVYRLTYSDLASAVTCLRSAFSGWPDPKRDPTPDPSAPAMIFRLADVSAPPPAPALDQLLSQRPATIARVIGDTLYLADPDGRAIHRMDPLAAAIWDMLDSPITAPELEALLSNAFAATDRSRIASDLRALLAAFADAGLIQRA
jgi:hypothetical protein